MYHVCFELNMPGVTGQREKPSWHPQIQRNDWTRWVLLSYKVGDWEAKKDKVVGTWQYKFPGGAVATVTGREITLKEKRVLTKIDTRSGKYYDFRWMVDSILNTGQIYNTQGYETVPLVDKEEK